MPVTVLPCERLRQSRRMDGRKVAGVTEVAKVAEREEAAHKLNSAAL